jgi:hypothetical protein
MNRFDVFHHIDQKTIDAMHNDYSPVFVLSCGRSGSKFIHHLLQKSNQAKSYHEAFPNLMYFPQYAYYHQEKREVLKMMVWAARMEIILDAFNENRIYMEANQCLSFFAPVLNDIFPKSKFIHLVRHPGDFVRSAIRKGWHTNDSIWESGRLKMEDPEWEKMSHIARLSWLWTQTNKYLSSVLSNLPPERVLLVKAEDMFTSINTIKRIYDFCGISVPVSDKDMLAFMKKPINELLIHPNEPANMRKTTSFPKYKEWDNELKEELRRFAGSLAHQYGYVI